MCPVLKGGARDRRVRSISKGKRIDRVSLGSEASVRRVVVTLGKGESQRKVKLAEKKFYPREKLPAYSKLHQPNLRNPEAQYKMMKRLQNLNRRYKLKLPILTTMRLRALKTGEKRIYSTVLKNVLSADEMLFGGGGLRLATYKRRKCGKDKNGKQLWGSETRYLKITSKQRRELAEERQRVILLLEAFGFRIEEKDAWVYTMDPKTREIKVWLGDYGNIVEVSPSKRREFFPFELKLLEEYLPQQ